MTKSIDRIVLTIIFAVVIISAVAQTTFIESTAVNNIAVVNRHALAVRNNREIVKTHFQSSYENSTLIMFVNNSRGNVPNQTFNSESIAYRFNSEGARMLDVFSEILQKYGDVFFTPVAKKSERQDLFYNTQTLIPKVCVGIYRVFINKEEIIKNS